MPYSARNPRSHRHLTPLKLVHAPRPPQFDSWSGETSNHLEACHHGGRSKSSASLGHIGRGTNLRQSYAQCPARCGGVLSSARIRTPVDGSRQETGLPQEWQLVEQHSGFGPCRPSGITYYATGCAATVTGVTASSGSQNQDGFDRRPNSVQQIRSTVLRGPPHVDLAAWGPVRPQSSAPVQVSDMDGTYHPRSYQGPTVVSLVASPCRGSHHVGAGVAAVLANNERGTEQASCCGCRRQLPCRAERLLRKSLPRPTSSQGSSGRPGCRRHHMVGRTSATPSGGLGGSWLTGAPLAPEKTALHRPCPRWPREARKRRPPPPKNSRISACGNRRDNTKGAGTVTSAAKARTRARPGIPGWFHSVDQQVCYCRNNKQGQCVHLALGKPCPAGRAHTCQECRRGKENSWHTKDGEIRNDGER